MPSRMAQASRYEDGSRAGLQARPGELGRLSLYQKRSSTWADHPSPRPSEISNSHRECRSSCRGPEVPRRQPPPSAEGTPGAHRLWPGTQQRATLTTMRVQSVADATVVSLGSRNKTPTRQSLLRTPNAPVYEQSARSKCSPWGHPFSDGPKGSDCLLLTRSDHRLVGQLFLRLTLLHCKRRSRVYPVELLEYQSAVRCNSCARIHTRLVGLIASGAGARQSEEIRHIDLDDPTARYAVVEVSVRSSVV